MFQRNILIFSRCKFIIEINPISKALRIWNGIVRKINTHKNVVKVNVKVGRKSALIYWHSEVKRKQRQRFISQTLFGYRSMLGTETIVNYTCATQI